MFIILVVKSRKLQFLRRGKEFPFDHKVYCATWPIGWMATMNPGLTGRRVAKVVLSVGCRNRPNEPRVGGQSHPGSSPATIDGQMGRHGTTRP